eukprot:TRINITY_DN16856_c0_g1_i1.p1 TRINITY_DN16856_c0_g1~~TRINITY_DN16856_c0_g1_i1.p1  ORF type:complete len:1849 (-),score=514.47 TRINITY_DN16856_c0_g1_i1:74-5620(-)
MHQVAKPLEVQSGEALLRETFEKLRASAPKRHKELRDACASALTALGAPAAAPAAPAAPAAASAAGPRGDEYFGVLRLACACQGSPEVVSFALHALQKLLAHAVLTGRGPDPFAEGEPPQQQQMQPRTLMDSVVETICNCAEQADDTVQLQMAHALLTAVTCQYCEVHGASLMLAVRTCFQIHRDSRNTMNQRTASASLGQMLSVVAQRMELSSTDLSRRASPQEEADSQIRQVRLQQSRDLALLPPEQVLEDWTASYLTRMVDRLVLDERAAASANGAAPGSVADAGPPPGKFGWCVVCRAPAPHYCVETQDPVCGHPCKFRNLERIALVEAHYGARRDEEESGRSLAGAGAAGGCDSASVAGTSDAASTSGHADNASSSAAEPPGVASAGSFSSIFGGSGGAGPSASFAAAVGGAASAPPRAAEGDEASAAALPMDMSALNPHHRDALMVFSNLCKLSMKDLPHGQTDTRLVRSKRLALELILNMLQNCGPVFRASEPFVAVLKEHLCASLIKNSVSSIPKIFGLSLQIFVTLISGFKEHLRTETGVFIEQIFLRILESGNSTYHHKHRVLHVIYKLCTDASTALELFLNFDCDVEERNIFAHMVDCLSKIAQGKYTSSEHTNLITTQQEQELKMLALQALVTLMGSIVDWSRRIQEEQQRERGTTLEKLNEDKERTSGAESDEDARSEAASAMPSRQTASILEQKQRKRELQVGINKFNMKPKRGIEYLQQGGFISDSPEAVADLFRNGDLGLDKTAIGDYLGEDKAFNKSVLYALVDGQDFKNEDLDASLRTFLSKFRLPGEAQKIDRMMEKFAEKYCQDNPGRFANADCAFVLSFSLIMLQTDLHNPGIKNKMTKEAFVKNNRGINDNADLPREYLETLYDSVARNPISLKEDEEARSRLESQNAQGASQKFDLFIRETESIVNRSQELMKAKLAKQKTSAYVAAENVEHVRPLFEAACWGMLATLAVLLETQEMQSSVELCIEGFKHCIRIAARFDMETERDAFVSSLAKFTYLTTIKEMKKKNIECIRALLAIGLSEGNNLGPSWQHVLHCISHLERLQLIGSRSKQDFQFFGDESTNAGSPSSSFASSAVPSGASTSAAGGSAAGAMAVPRTLSTAGGSQQVLKRRAHGLGVSALVSLGTENRQVEQLNSESVTSAIDAAQIDLLFNRSTSLGSSAIVHFVTQLARVSKEELALLDQPRIFSLQKLVEVTDFNMGRLRYVFSRIWRVVSAHFIEVACHPNIRVCMFAIDSLRQLAIKFLEKDELANYHFQADFLRPFGVVMHAAGAGQDVKELIVSILSNLVQSRINSIKSGWKIVFQVLHTAANDPGNEKCAEVAFAIVEKVVNEHYEIFVDNFTDGVRALLAFGQCKASLSMSLKAVAMLVRSAEYLADDSSPAPPPPPSGLAQAGADASHAAAHWFPILRGAAMLVSDPRREVRGAALNAAFDILRRHGKRVFDQDTWRMVFNGVIKPLFDDIHHQLQDSTHRPDGTAASWAAAMAPPTCLAAMTELVKLFDANLEAVAFLLDDVLTLIVACVQHDIEMVSRIGVSGFKQLLVATGSRLPEEAWSKVTTTILQLLGDSMPTKLLLVDPMAPEGARLPFSQQEVVAQCVVHLLLIDSVQDIIKEHYGHIPPSCIMNLLNGLQGSIDFAHKFNQRIDLRQALKRLGFMKEMLQLPGLLKQEREALSCSLRMLFRLQSDERIRGDQRYAADAQERLSGLCCAVLRNYAEKERLLREQTSERAGDADASSAAARAREAAAVETEREVVGLVTIVSGVVLTGLRELPPANFAGLAQRLFPLLADLVVVNAPEVRTLVREVLVERVQPLMQLLPGVTSDAVRA